MYVDDLFMYLFWGGGREGGGRGGEGEMIRLERGCEMQRRRNRGGNGKNSRNFTSFFFSSSVPPLLPFIGWKIKQTKKKIRKRERKRERSEWEEEEEKWGEIWQRVNWFFRLIFAPNWAAGGGAAGSGRRRGKFLATLPWRPVGQTPLTAFFPSAWQVHYS